MASNSSSIPNVTPSSRSGSILRVLCLHDAESNSFELSVKLKSLGDKLYRNHGIDLVFVDAPLIVNPKLSDKNTEGEHEDEGKIQRRSNDTDYYPPRTWWIKEEISRTRVLGRDNDEEKNKGEDKKEVAKEKENKRI